MAKHRANAKFGWHPLSDVVAITNAGAKPLKFAGVPDTLEPTSDVGGPKFAILWRRMEDILLFNNFFRIVDTCLSCEDIARQSCAMVRR